MLQKADLVLSNEERSQMVSFARSRSRPAALSSADGEANLSIAQRLYLTKATVGKWRKRYVERRTAGLYADVHPGGPHTIDYERVEQLIKTSLHIRPANGSTHWSAHTVAAETGISKTSVQRYSSCSVFSRIAPRESSCPPTRSSSRSGAMWWACT